MADLPDPFVAEHIEHGVKEFRLFGRRSMRRKYEPDTVEATYRREAEDAFDPGDAWPDNEHLRITEVETSVDGPGFLHRLRGEGIANGDTWKELDRQNNSAETGWDEIALEIYTRDIAAGRWGKGERMQADALTSIAATASTDTLTKVAHGLVTGQLLQDFTFGSGFAGLTSGNDYFVIKLTADTFKLATTRANAEAYSAALDASATSITGTASTDVIDAVAHGFSNGDVGLFGTLNGGAGLTAGTVPYYIVNATTDTFKVSLTPGGSAVNFTSNITSGSTFRRGTCIDITTDGTGASATPIVFGHELMFITDRRDRPAEAKDYHHLDLEFRGLLMRDGDSKPIVRQWDVGTGKYTSKFNGLATLTADIYSGFPPTDTGTDLSLSGTSIPIEYDVPQVRVTDTMVTTTEPNANWLYIGWEPENAPSVSLYSMSSESYTYTFPYGWKLDAFTVQQIPGKSIWLMSLTWIKRPAAIPTTTEAAP